MVVNETLQRITHIQAELAALNGQTPVPPATPAAAAASPTAAGAPGSFAATLAQAQSVSPAAARSLTPGQSRFAARLAAETGLNPNVVAAWLLAEESGGAAASRQSANNNDWLNIGYTDSGTFGAGAAIWRDPDSAAHATAGWLKGLDTIPGYGRASAGVQSILRTTGQSPEAQVAAIQHSGWASGGYPSLPALYRQVSR
jgi:hypothetical protein